MTYNGAGLTWLCTGWVALVDVRTHATRWSWQISDSKRRDHSRVVVEQNQSHALLDLVLESDGQRASHCVPAMMAHFASERPEVGLCARHEAEQLEERTRAGLTRQKGIGRYPRTTPHEYRTQPKPERRSRSTSRTTPHGANGLLPKESGQSSLSTLLCRS